MPKDKEQVDVDLDGLVNWIESRPELQDLRKQADDTVVIYRPKEAKVQDRFYLARDKLILESKNGLLGKFLNTIWVPARNLRGTAYSTSSIDSTLGTTSKMLSISTLWDFVCTLPLFTFGLTPIGIAALPAAVILSYLILWASNVSGEKSTDRHDPIQSKSATFGLIAFLLLSLTKTAFSGVGVDLVLGNRQIQSTYAAQLGKEKLEKLKNDSAEELKSLKEGDATLMNAKGSCSALNDQLKNNPRKDLADERRYQGDFVRAYGTIAERARNESLTNPQLIKKYGSIGKIPGVCNQQKIIERINSDKITKIELALQQKTKAINTMSALSYLRKMEPETYKTHFKDLENESIDWVSGTTAVAQATEQFWAKLLAGKYGQIGFSLFFLIVSLVLSITALLMLYQVSIAKEVKASYDDDVQALLNARLQAYSKEMETLNTEED